MADHGPAQPSRQTHSVGVPVGRLMMLGLTASLCLFDGASAQEALPLVSASHISSQDEPSAASKSDRDSTLEDIETRLSHKEKQRADTHLRVVKTGRVLVRLVRHHAPPAAGNFQAAFKGMAHRQRLHALLKHDLDTLSKIDRNIAGLLEERDETRARRRKESARARKQRQRTALRNPPLVSAVIRGDLSRKQTEGDRLTKLPVTKLPVTKLPVTKLPVTKLPVIPRSAEIARVSPHRPAAAPPTRAKPRRPERTRAQGVAMRAPHPLQGKLQWPLDRQVKTVPWRASKARALILFSGGQLAVRAAASGRVIFAGTQRNGQLAVTVDHGRGLRTAYRSLGRTEVEVGDSLSAGARLGWSLDDGRPLRFEVRLQGKSLAPRTWLAPAPW